MHVCETLHLFINSLPLAMTPQNAKECKRYEYCLDSYADRASRMSRRIHTVDAVNGQSRNTRSPLIKAKLGRLFERDRGDVGFVFRLRALTS